jgi:flagellin
MALSILNNISAMTAENQLSVTQANLQSTLTQLSSGQRINSGADDAAGLSVANGLKANIAALTQSAQNASNGIGEMQVADGALSQVTSLLNRAVTLATEASNGTLDSSGDQATALNTEFQSIITEINSIGTNTKFNGTQVFGSTNAGNALSIFMSDSTNGGSGMSTSMTINHLTAAAVGLAGTKATATLSGSANLTAADSVTIGGKTYTFDTAANVAASSSANVVALGSTLSATLQNLADAVNGTGSAGTQYSSSTTANANVTVTSTNATNLVFSADQAGTGGNSIAATVAGGTGHVGFTDTVGGNMAGGAGSALDLTSSTDAATALTQINAAISTVAAWRGSLGATINQTTAASNVMNTEVQNLSSAQNDIMAADVGQTVANMTKYNILEQTGMAALSQSNQAQQAVLKLLQ